MQGEARARVSAARGEGDDDRTTTTRWSRRRSAPSGSRACTAAEELFALTLTDAINEVARQGWEYVRAEHLPAEAPRGWFRGAVAGRADRARLPPPARGARARGWPRSAPSRRRRRAEPPARRAERRPPERAVRRPDAVELRRREPPLAAASRGSARPARRRRRRCARRRGSGRPRSPDQPRLRRRGPAPARARRPRARRASTRCTARLRSTRLRPSKAAARITTRKCVSPPSRQPPWPRCCSLSSMTSRWSGAKAAVELARGWSRSCRSPVPPSRSLAADGPWPAAAKV